MHNDKYVWDEDKYEKNIKKHRISFEEAATVFSDINAVYSDDEAHYTYDEERFKVIGMSKTLKMLVVCHCYRNGDRYIRIFSARKATKREQIIYRKG